MIFDIALCRTKFEEITVKNLKNPDSKKKISGEYAIPLIEDHWQTFQEGWEECETYLRKNT